MENWILVCLFVGFPSASLSLSFLLTESPTRLISFPPPAGSASNYVPAVCNGREVVDSTTSSLWSGFPRRGRAVTPPPHPFIRQLWLLLHPFRRLIIAAFQVRQTDGRTDLWLRSLSGGGGGSDVKSFSSIGLLSCDLIGLHIDVMKCTVPCTEQSCGQMGACEAVVLLHDRKKKKICYYRVLTVLWIYPNVVV